MQELIFFLITLAILYLVAILPFHLKTLSRIISLKIGIKQEAIAAIAAAFFLFGLFIIFTYAIKI